jgi:hypothetical protein
METDVLKLNWISGDGGPLILMEQKHLANWEGSNAPSNGRVVEANSRWGLEVATDYDIACDVEVYLGLINVGEGKALVLGGDELATTWFPVFENQEGILIRWNYGNSESKVIEFAKAALGKFEKDEVVEFTLEDSELILFVAAESGNDKIYPRLNFNLSSGTYKISTIEREDEQTSVICHHFRKIV